MVIGVTTFFVGIISMVILKDMPDYQRKYVKQQQALIVMTSWVDFIGDVAWAHQRFRAYDKGAEEFGYIIGMCSLMVLVTSCALCTYGVLRHVLHPFRDKLRIESLTSNLYITVLLISFSNPEAIIFFPWKEDAYTESSLQTAVPSASMLKVTLIRLLEDFPQFILQVVSLVVSGWDNFTAINLGMTLVLVVYMVIGKALRIYFSDLLQIEHDVEGGGEFEIPSLRHSISHRLSQRFSDVDFRFSSGSRTYAVDVSNPNLNDSESELCDGSTQTDGVDDVCEESTSDNPEIAHIMVELLYQTELKSKDEVIKSNYELIENQQSELKSKDEVIENQQSELKSKDEVIASLQAELESMRESKE